MTPDTSIIGPVHERMPLLDCATSCPARCPAAPLAPTDEHPQGPRATVSHRARAPTRQCDRGSFFWIPVGTEKFEARATQVFGAERDRLFADAAKLMPLFADYQTKTGRQIPLLILTRIEQGNNRRTCATVRARSIQCGAASRLLRESSRML